MEDYLESAYKCIHCSNIVFVKFPDGGPAYKIVRCPSCLDWIIVTCVGVDNVDVAIRIDENN